MIRRLSMTTVVAAAALYAGAVAGQAQTGSSLTASQPDCQTVLQCNFRRGGVYRACISAYSCRRCRRVRSRKCTTGNDGRRVCRRLVCSWG